jgi:hypothetical protein
MDASKIQVDEVYFVAPPHGKGPSALVRVLNDAPHFVVLDKKAKAFVGEVSTEPIDEPDEYGLSVVEGVLCRVEKSSWPLLEEGTDAVVRYRFIKSAIDSAE